MTMLDVSQPITIFEGPDGGGKTTAAKRFASQTNARYVHFGPMPRVRHGLSRMYVEAMLPALLGYQPVVMDRCWLSEKIYADVYRDGVLRSDAIELRMIERLAWRCGAVVVSCYPSFEQCLRSFNARRDDEYLDNERQLKQVYDLYSEDNLRTSLPMVIHDYTNDSGAGWEKRLADDIESIRPPRHWLTVSSAGNLDAQTVIVGESFADHKDTDPLYQWPFASFSRIGCSRWLTEQLQQTPLTEDLIFWVNADQDLVQLLNPRFKRIIKLGDGKLPHELSSVVGRVIETVPHPQYWRRFKSSDRYPLLDLLSGGKS